MPGADVYVHARGHTQIHVYMADKNTLFNGCACRFREIDLMLWESHQFAAVGAMLICLLSAWVGLGFASRSKCHPDDTLGGTAYQAAGGLFPPFVDNSNNHRFMFVTGPR